MPFRRIYERTVPHTKEFRLLELGLAIMAIGTFIDAPPPSIVRFYPAWAAYVWATIIFAGAVTALTSSFGPRDANHFFWERNGLGWMGIGTALYGVAAVLTTGANAWTVFWLALTVATMCLYRALRLNKNVERKLIIREVPDERRG